MVKRIKSKLTVFLFHRSLRIIDNIGLYHALNTSNLVIPIFIFDPKQITMNEYFNSNAFQFLLDSLNDLQEQFQLLRKKIYFFHNNPISVLNSIFKEVKYDSIVLNKDYTPFSLEREQKIREFCNKHKIHLTVVHDCAINNPDVIKSQKHTPYTIFTPYFKFSRKIPVIEPQEFNEKKSDQFIEIELGNAFLLKEARQKFLKSNTIPTQKGGREEGIKILKSVQKYIDYDKNRNFPGLNGTTGLSPHLKFGTISIREAYSHISKIHGNEHPLLRQLYWHDFFTYIGFHFPHVFIKSFKEKYNQIKWNNDDSKFALWKQGITGFPIVDAGMRELNSTGIMHNRVRMIVASFLTKDLHINWQWGERYFAQMLTDYDPALNNGNWQWAASTGCDSQPYFRIFNPWSQQKTYDPDAIYIKKWIPELADYAAKIIHNLEKKRPKELLEDVYPKPIVNHKKERELTLFMFKTLSGKEVSF
ncbi:deoxyribodipyrimidine photo-lyase [Candidatus Lokiarchaeum ossiferum]|uniref:deoxyribodipyrimidine photo-lyase n=1 Tax=Candidatus Lokiarchaeum ossiferum TaxID=2951803 RepID=UPI00352CC522